MDRWKDKIAVVTGASSGIGAAIVKDLVDAGLTVVGLARREDRLILVRNTIRNPLKSRFLTIKCDVSNEKDVKDTFNWIKANLGGIDILVNCAGIMRHGFQLITMGNSGPVREIFETNVFGVIYCTREAFSSMKERGSEGHVVIMNSVLGHNVANIIGREGNSSTNLYAVSKFSISAMVDTYRQEFINAGTKVKITSISPGIVSTDLISEEIRNSRIPLLNPKDVSAAVVYAIGTPPHVQIHDLVIKPIGERI